MKKTNYSDRIETESEKKIRRRSFLSFLGFGTMSLLGVAGWKWLNRQPADTGILQPLRSTLETNEKILTSTFSENHLVKTYSVKQAVRNTRINGMIGLQSNLDTMLWRLSIKKAGGETLMVSLDDIKKLPKTDIVYDFKCVEGWSEVQHWGGVPFRDFMTAFGLADQSGMKYVGMKTPDGKYYVGLDMQSAMHPQTMLCYEMNGRPLIYQHGAPLRLIIPVKYGIKNLKTVGEIFFSDTKPPDYWAERGYDYYAGL